MVALLCSRLVMLSAQGNRSPGLAYPASAQAARSGKLTHCSIVTANLFGQRRHSYRASHQHRQRASATICLTSQSRGTGPRCGPVPLSPALGAVFLRSPFGAPFNLKADSAPQVLRAAGQIVAVSRALTGQSPAN